MPCTQLRMFGALFAAALLVWCRWHDVSAQMYAGDLAVLSDFRARMENADQLGWKSQNPCLWTGIKCSGSFVSSITLTGLALGGSVTPYLNKLTSLTFLSLQRNRFAGALPSLRGLSSLESCYLNDNNFDAIPGDFFRNLSSLRYLYLHDNPSLNLSSPQGGWSLPTDLQFSTFLTNLSITNTSLVGQIPPFLGSMSSLSMLGLAYNRLGGGIPPTFSSSSLQQLQANNQFGPRLSGTLKDVGNIVSLRLLWLHENDFSGVLPPNLTSSISLSDLRLNDNRLVGPIPPSYTTLPLSVFAVENNQLDGPLPAFKGKFTHDNNFFCLSTLGLPCAPQVAALLNFLGSINYPYQLVSSWRGNNPCASWIGILCNSDGNVVVINLAFSNLSGFINPSVSQLASLTTLKLNNNRLIGTVPSALVHTSTLKLIDLSNNNLTGPLPVFPPSVAINTAFNPFINKSLSSPSIGPASRRTAKRKSRLLNVISIVAGCLLVTVASVFAAVYVMRKRTIGDAKSPTKKPLHVFTSTKKPLHVFTSTKKMELGLQSPVTSEEGSFAFSMQTLQMATSNFSQEFYLGRGGFGSVYRGHLDDGTLIAVKKMDSDAMTSRGQREFESELSVLTKLRHRHLVAILGYCIEGDERALVYEYMSGGSLNQHLFEWSIHRMPPLSWKSRLSIALDIARGLEYLHGLAQRTFIHRDLKPSNVLLDESLRAKISDFGLLRLVPEGEKQSIQTLIMAGTYGYLPPEYTYTGQISTRGDVFSFGVVLMELITGRPALDNSQPGAATHLMISFRQAIGKDRLLDTIDPNMSVDRDDEKTVQGIRAASELACHCTNKEASSRPDMGHAVNVLAPLVKAWKPNESVCTEAEPNLTLEEVQRKLLSGIITQ